MTEALHRARAAAGLLLVLGLIAALLADMLSATATLPDRTLSVFITLIVAFFGLDILTERRDKIIAALTAALDAWQNNDD